MMRQRTAILFIFLFYGLCWDEPSLLMFSSAFNTVSSSITATITNNNLLLKHKNNNNAISPSFQVFPSLLSLPLVSKRSSKTSICSQWELLATTKDDGDNKEEEEEENSVPNIQSLRDDIRKWSRVRSPHAPNEAAHALREMFRYYNPNNKQEKAGNENEEGRHTNSPQRRETVDVFDCTQVINSWSKSNHKNAQQQILAILAGMNASYKINKIESIRPNVVTYNTIINAYARRGDYDGSEKIFMIQLNDYKNEHNIPAKPDIRTFTAMINACSKCDRDDKPEVAMKLLKTINNWYERGDLGEGPDIITYSAVINCWSKSNRPEGPSRALNILETMIAKYKEDGSNIRPDMVTYSSVMDAFAKQGDNDGTNKVFTMMKDDYKSGNVNSKPDIRTYNTIIDAWSKSNNPNAPMEAESLLIEMIDFHSKGGLEEGPDTVTYNAVINCWSKSNRPEGPSRALEILETMISRYKEDRNKNVRPDTITYSSIMNAYARQGDTDGAIKVFMVMKEDYNSGNNNSKPNIRTYNTVIDAWSKSNSPNAPKEAESLLMKITDLFSKGDLEEGPDMITYTAVINCWSKSNRPEAPSRALDILETMIAKYKEEDGNKNIRPDTITYNTVMDVYAKQGDIDGANKVFTMMKDDYKSGNINSKPDKFTNTILTDAWNNYSGSQNAPFDIEKILELKNKD